MNKLLIIGLVLGLLLVAGCSAQGSQQQYDYIPAAGQGCVFEAADIVENNILTSDLEIVEVPGVL